MFGKVQNRLLYLTLVYGNWSLGYNLFLPDQCYQCDQSYAFPWLYHESHDFPWLS